MGWLIPLAVSAGIFLAVIPLVQRRRNRRHRYLIRDQYHQPPMAGLGTDEQRRDAMRDSVFVEDELRWARRSR